MNNQIDIAKENYLKYKNKIDQHIEQFLSTLDNSVLSESIRYSLQNGGKKIRSYLAILCFESSSGSKLNDNNQFILDLCLAIELLHSMSLIHDDLPCMDNDDYRRGKLTNHKVFGEAIALLAGDALIVMAYDVILKRFKQHNISTDVTIIILEMLNECIGHRGMIGGQSLDILSESDKTNKYEIETIHTLKTAKFFAFACFAGALLGCNSRESAQKYFDFGIKLGLAFQISDDLFDSKHSVQESGKNPGKDVENNKLTYLSTYGLDKTKNYLEILLAETKSFSSGLSSDSYSQFSYIIEWVNCR